jgi:hypothetical protein
MLEFFVSSLVADQFIEPLQLSSLHLGCSKELGFDYDNINK